MCSGDEYAKRGRKPKSRGLLGSCRICACFFAIRLRKFGKASRMSTENSFAEPKREDGVH